MRSCRPSCSVESEMPLSRKELLAPVRAAGGPLRSLAFQIRGQPRVLAVPGALERALLLPLRRTAAAGVSVAVFLHLAAVVSKEHCSWIDCEDQATYWLKRSRAAVASLPGTVTVVDPPGAGWWGAMIKSSLAVGGGSS